MALSTGAIAGIVLSAVAVIALFFGLLFFARPRRTNSDLVTLSAASDKKTQKSSKKSAAKKIKEEPQKPAVDKAEEQPLEDAVTKAEKHLQKSADNDLSPDYDATEKGKTNWKGLNS